MECFRQSSLERSLNNLLNLFKLLADYFEKRLYEWVFQSPLERSLSISYYLETDITFMALLSVSK